MGPAIWLRTHYALGSNLKHEMLVAGVDMRKAVDGDHRLLSLRRLHNYGPDWQRMFQALPELLENYVVTAVVPASKASGWKTRSRALQSQVHSECVVTWLVVEDEEALRSGKVAVMFVDACGNEVRSRRVEAGVAEDVGGFWASSSWTEMDEWENAEYGHEYQSGGSRGVSCWRARAALAGQSDSQRLVTM
ncbi:MAG: hypothetical protein Q9173_006278 [Seirophora scorigena]